MLTRKGEMLEFIRTGPKTWTQLIGKFSGDGYTNSCIYKLMADGLVYKPKRGLYAIKD